MTLLPTAYLPNLEYFSILFKNKNACIDKHERYEKQTFRNRCTILTGNGELNLSVPVIRPKGKNTLVGETEISYAENWQKDHYRAIESAYRNTPYFEYYWDALLKIMDNDFHYLSDLNLALTEHLCDKIGLTVELSPSTDFVDFKAKDYRKTLHPKESNTFEAKHYIQTFEERHGFNGNPSIIDLLFNEGPNSISILQESTSANLL